MDEMHTLYVDIPEPAIVIHLMTCNQIKKHGGVSYARLPNMFYIENLAGPDRAERLATWLSSKLGPEKFSVTRGPCCL